jgi:hypothetical protein
MKSAIYLFFTISVFIHISISQPVGRNEVRSLVMNKNNISTVVYNTGSVSNPGVTANVLDFAWKGLGYAYEIGLMVGAQVPIGTLSDSMVIVSEGYGSSNGSTADGDFAPDGTTKWGFMPISGYAKEYQHVIANNLDPMTWPLSWNEWPGKYGKALADLEVYYAMNDFSDREFEYYPSGTDTSMRGLGLQVESRYYQFAHPELEDMFFTIFDIKNAGDKTLPNVVTGIFGDPHVGGSNNFGDDATNIDISRKLIYSWDPDNASDIPSIPPGYFGAMFTETPENIGMTSYAALLFGGYNRPKNDDLMFSKMTPGLYTPELYNPPEQNVGDYVMIAGSGSISLKSNSTVTLGVAYICADDKTDLISKADRLGMFYSIFFSPKTGSISITAPVGGQTVQTNSISIQWNASALNGDTTVSLYYSNTYGPKWWNEIAHNVPNTGSYEWHAAGMPDGIFYKLYIVNKSGGIALDSTVGFITINRPGDASPEVVMLHPLQKRYTGTIPITWIAGDADGDPVTMKIFSSENNGATYSLLTETANSGVYLFDTRKVPNSTQARIKIEATAGSASTSAESVPFRIANFFMAITDTASMKHVAGSATGSVFPGIADSSEVSGHKYRVTFDSVAGSLRYTLKDLTDNIVKLYQFPINTITGSGEIVDGLRLWFRNDPIGIDSATSAFETPIGSVVSSVARPTLGVFRPAPIDVGITFGSMDTTSNGDYISPLDSAGSSNPNVKTVRMPFKVTIVDDTTTVQLLIKDQYSVGKQFRWDFGEEIVVLTPPPYRSASNNAHIGIQFRVQQNEVPVIPPGSRFIARTTRPFTVNDVYEFTAEHKYGQPTGAAFQPAQPISFHLKQNYPNPFNPVTTIEFSIANPAVTTLTVYDIMGRSVKEIVNQSLGSGHYRFEWNGLNSLSQPSASGIYFYRLQSGSNIVTKKMLLMK